MAKRKTAYVCSDCGAEFPRWQGQCSECKEWNTISEFVVSSAKAWQHRKASSLCDAHVAAAASLTTCPPTTTALVAPTAPTPVATPSPVATPAPTATPAPAARYHIVSHGSTCACQFSAQTNSGGPLARTGN